MRKSELRKIIREELTKTNQGSFDKLYDKYDKKDYWKLNDFITLQKKQLKSAQERGDKNARKYTEKDVEDYIRKNNKDAVEVMYRQLTRNIQANNKRWLKNRLRHDQHFMLDAFRDITGTDPGKTTKDIHKFIDAMDEG